MNQSEAMKKLEIVYESNAKKLICWALRRLKSAEDAEDMCQEAMLRLYIAISRESEGQNIEDLEKYLWKIVGSLMRVHQQGSEKARKLARNSEIDLDVELQLCSEDTQETHQDTDYLFKKLKKSISMLDYNHREAMIMFHIEKKTLKEISKKLNVTEVYVKKLLAVARQKIRTNEENKLYDVKKEYRVNHLLMSFSGETQSSEVFQRITDSLCKQNICLACYDAPRSIGELADLLGLPCEYIEFDLKWLSDRGLVKKLKNKYSTNFFIFDETFKAMLIDTFFKHKTSCLDKITNNLTILQNRIRAINFLHSDKPIDELLWLLIYSFTDIASARTCFDESEHGLRNLISADGGQCYPIGLFDNQSKIQINPLFREKYKELENWECNGTYTFDDGENRLNWVGLFNAREGFYSKLSKNAFAPDIFVYKELVFKIIQSNLNINHLPEEERYILSQLIDFGYLSVSEDGNNVLPNFYVFTPNQRKQLDNIFIELYGEMKSEFSHLHNDLYKRCKDILPKQLGNYYSYISYFSLLFSHIFSTGFAYYDGKLYKPKNETDCTLLTLNMTLSNKPVSTKQVFSVNLKINFEKK
jgi:RNA polymerase sigma factor (sigma-70 family)